MNSRIEDLSKIASQYARNHILECETYGYYMDHNEYETRFQEKFAELVIQETFIFVTNELNVMWDGGLKHTKEHFGVE